MNPSVTRLCGYAGLIGACAMFAGDMLFYGQWGSGADALSRTYEIVAQGEPRRLTIGGLMSVIGGLGYTLGTCHVYGRLSARPAWLRLCIAAGFLAIAVIATATHAVWGSFALAVVGASDPTLIANYLAMHFAIGGVVSVPAAGRSHHIPADGLARLVCGSESRSNLPLGIHCTLPARSIRGGHSGRSIQLGFCAVLRSQPRRPASATGILTSATQPQRSFQKPVVERLG